MKSLTTIALLLISSIHPQQSQAMTECELLTRVMNNLGAKMSINRYVISSKKDEALIKQASNDLSEQTKNYRAAKEQYKKANCKSIWDN
ncbi:hypothetical protein WB44_06155 [Synechococcus sp. WH 8020]|uniref:hypothetical protein n=1 Tax=unclassified Synechococcus TaxID=2626047 RepID=UPI000652841B|nr:hypothetical protein [Synechococcus sp. WH 8020]AKN60747.1 hypothetical protein WB44_06155 [Synechococcus sp. WH 8020]